jgi:hypothetical protein
MKIATMTTLWCVALAAALGPAARIAPAAMVLPDSLSGLQLWLKAGEGVYSTFSDDGNFGNDVLAGDGDSVSGWRDYSGNNRHVLQTNANFKPTYATDTGLAFVSFDGDETNDDYLERIGTGSSLPLSPTAADETIIAVFTRPDVSGNRWIFGEYRDNSRYAHGFGIASGATQQMRFDHFSPSGNSLNSADTADDAILIAMLDKEGTSMRFTVIDSIDQTPAVTTSAAGDTYTSGGTVDVFQIGSRRSSSAEQIDSFDGQLAEFIIFDRRLTDNELEGVGEYLAAKYFVPEPSGLILALVGFGLLGMRAKGRQAAE